MKKTPAERRAVRRAALEKRFAALYVANGRNGGKAYMGLFPQCSRVSARTKGAQWLAKVGVSEEVRRLCDEAWKREHIAADEVLGRMGRISRKDIGDYYWRPGELDRKGKPTTTGGRKPLHELTPEQRECIEGVDIKDGQEVWEFASKQKQLEMMGKHFKLFTDEVMVKFDDNLAAQMARARKRVQESNAAPSAKVIDKAAA